MKSVGQHGLLLWLLLVSLCPCAGSDEFRLIEDVVKMNAVLNSVYPDSGNLISVNLTFFPINIIALHELQQSFIVSGWFYVTWYDPKLQWTPAEYGNISRVYVAHDQIWKPDLTVINGAESLHSVAGLHTDLVLHNDGRVQWYPGNVLSAICKMDLSFFPFDHQDCFFQLSTWAYTTDTVVLHPDPHPIRLDSWHPNSEWELEGTRCTAYHKSSNGVHYPYVEYHFLLKRRSAFYVIKFLAPIVLLSAVNAFVFCVPPESGEKVSLAVSTMLSLTVFLAYLTDFTPSNTDTVPQVAVFVFLHLALGACGVVCNILLLRLHFHRCNGRRLDARGRGWGSRGRHEAHSDLSPRSGRPKDAAANSSLWLPDVDDEVIVITADDDISGNARNGNNRRNTTTANVNNNGIKTVVNFSRNSSPSHSSPRRTDHLSDSPKSAIWSDVINRRYRSFRVSDTNENEGVSFTQRRKAERFPGACLDRSDLYPGSGPAGAGFCTMDRIGNVCFVVFLVLSVVVSASFFFKQWI